MHSTNYRETFILVSPTTKATAGTEPPERNPPTVARLSFEMLAGSPYQYTSDEVMFAVHALRKAIAPSEQEAARAQFFSKGQPCMRASPLTQRYGWGVHYDQQGRMALVGMETDRYSELKERTDLKVKAAMRTR